MSRREHDWSLTKPPWHSRDEDCTTMFSWRCSRCGAETITSTSHGNVGERGAHAFSPSDRRLARVGILSDCDEELCRHVLVA